MPCLSIVCATFCVVELEGHNVLCSIRWVYLLYLYYSICQFGSAEPGDKTVDDQIANERRRQASHDIVAGHGFPATFIRADIVIAGSEEPRVQHRRQHASAQAARASRG